MQLYPLRYEPIAGKEAHTQTVIDLIHRADMNVHAGDPDDEGQLLVEELLEYTDNRKPVKRPTWLCFFCLKGNCLEQKCQRYCQ